MKMIIFTYMVARVERICLSPPGHAARDDPAPAKSDPHALSGCLR